MPTTAEIEMMITDPKQWLQDYKVGEHSAALASGSRLSNFQLNDGSTEPTCRCYAGVAHGRRY